MTGAAHGQLTRQGVETKKWSESDAKKLQIDLSDIRLKGHKVIAYDSHRQSNTVDNANDAVTLLAIICQRNLIRGSVPGCSTIYNYYRLCLPNLAIQSQRAPKRTKANLIIYLSGRDEGILSVVAPHKLAHSFSPPATGSA